MTEAYSEPYQTSKMKRFAKIVNVYKSLNDFTKRSILDSDQALNTPLNGASLAAPCY